MPDSPEMAAALQRFADVNLELALSTLARDFMRGLIDPATLRTEAIEAFTRWQSADAPSA